MRKRIQRWGQILLAAVLLVVAGYFIFVAHVIFSSIHDVSGVGVIRPYRVLGYCIALFYELLAVFGLVPAAIELMADRHDNEDDDDDYPIASRVVTLEAYNERYSA